MKRILTLLIICLPLLVSAQEAKYLEGAVPVIDGKVTFSSEMKAPGMPKEQIYKTLLDWAIKRYQPTEKLNARILYQKPEESNFVIGGEEYIVFSSSPLSLDRTRIYYLLNVVCDTEKCNLTLTRIRYWYEEERDGGEKFTAEERITDKEALNKSKTKLYPIYGKFRRKTIDFKDELFNEVRTTLANQMIALGLTISATSTDASVPQANQQLLPTPPTAKVEVPTISTSQNGNDIETLIKQAVRITITAGNDEQFEIGKEGWGGFSELFGKKVVSCLIDTQKTMGNMLMVQNDHYKISFYGPNEQQPTVVVHCKKLMQQNLKGEEAIKQNSKCQIEKSYNMYIGEMLE